MDKRIFDLKFGLTLQLEPSIYGFSTDTDPFNFVFTTCYYFLHWLVHYEYSVEYIENNLFFVREVYDLDVIRAELELYYEESQNECQYFAV